jgi:hypothetical protein
MGNCTRTDFNSIDLWVVSGARHELNRDGSRIVRGYRKRLNGRPVLATCGSKDVIIRKHLYAVDEHVELTQTGGGPLPFPPGFLD